MPLRATDEDSHTDCKNLRSDRQCRVQSNRFAMAFLSMSRPLAFWLRSDGVQVLRKFHFVGATLAADLQFPFPTSEQSRKSRIRFRVFLVWRPMGDPLSIAH